MFQRRAARWLTIRPPRKRYGRRRNWCKIYDDGSTRIASFFDRRDEERKVSGEFQCMDERERERERKGAKVEWKTRRKGENGQWRIIRVSVARRGWNSWLDRSRLRDGDKLFISRRLATGQHFPYLSTILRLFIRAWAHVVVGRASLSPLCLFPSFTPTVATVHPRNSWSFPKIHEDSRTFTIRIKCSETNGKGREIKLK